jgi:hypothetical protein
MRLTKHVLQHQWVVAAVDEECNEAVPQIVKSEPRAILRDHPVSHSRRSDVIRHDLSDAVRRLLAWPFLSEAL